MKSNVSDATVSLEVDKQNRLRVQSSMNYDEYVHTFDRPPRCPLIRPIKESKSALMELSGFTLEPQLSPRAQSAIQLTTAAQADMFFSLEPAEKPQNAKLTLLPVGVSCAHAPHQGDGDLDDEDPISEECDPIKLPQATSQFVNKFVQNQTQPVNVRRSIDEAPSGTILQIIERRERSHSFALGQKKDLNPLHPIY